MYMALAVSLLNRHMIMKINFIELSTICKTKTKMSVSFILLILIVKFISVNSRHTQPDCSDLASSIGDAGDPSIVRGETGIRLIGGCNNRSGELQVNIYSQGWSSVCYDSFSHFDAQFACNFLGFPFVESIYEISTSAASSEFRFSCTAADLANEVNQIVRCSSFGSQPPCTSYAGVVCDTSHPPSQGFVAIVAYNYGAKFDIIAPDDGVFEENCNMGYGFCHGVYFGNKNNSQLNSVINILKSELPEGATRHCGDYGNITKFGITCSPLPGEPVLTIKNNRGRDIINTEGLVWYFDEEFEWMNICDDGLGYIEAQVLCNTVGFPYFSYLESEDQPPNQNHSKVISSIRCVGSEERLAECQIHIVNTSDSLCTRLSTVGCAGSLMEPLNDRALIIFESIESDAQSDLEFTANFTVISPKRGLYLTNCSATLLESDYYCPGVHLIKENNTGLQAVDVDLWSCQGIEYGLFGKQCNPITATVTSTVTVTTESQVDLSGANSLVVSLSVVGVLFVIVGLVAGIGCLIGYRHMNLKRMDKARREIIKDLQERHNSTTSSNDGPRYIQVRSCHKPIKRRRSSATHHRLENEQWEIPFECITLGEELGSGAYGIICKGVIDCCHQDEPVDAAVKLLKKYATESERRSLMQEIDLMKDIGYHRHVVSMLACCTQGNEIALIMDFMPYGNLQMFLKKRRDSELEVNLTGSLASAVPNSYIMGGESVGLSTVELTTESKSKSSLTLTEQLQFARQITLGMEYLAQLKIVHRDLATRNVLIDEEMFLKVADFGLSRDVYSDNSYHMAHNKDRLPVRWMAVESIIDREFSVASDVWSFGVVLWEIVTCGTFPYYHMNNLEVISKVQDGYRLPKPESCSNEMYDIMMSCWHKIPSQRPCFTDLRGMLDELLDKGEYTSLM